MNKSLILILCLVGATLVAAGKKQKDEAPTKDDSSKSSSASLSEMQDDQLNGQEGTSEKSGNSDPIGHGISNESIGESAMATQGEQSEGQSQGQDGQQAGGNFQDFSGQF